MSTIGHLILFLVLMLNSNGQIVHCDGEECNCPDVTGISSTGICILDCDAAGICKRQTLNCRDNDACQVICDGIEACSNTTINGNRATDVSIVCSTTNTCTQAMKIQCGTGHCVLQCGAHNSCTDLGPIDVSLSASFECIGDCPARFSSFTLPQTVATSAPTLDLWSNAIFLIAFGICIITILLFGCCNCLFYIRMNKQLKKYVAEQNAKQIDSKSSWSHVSSPRTPLSPISEEIPQSPKYITRLNAPRLDVPMQLQMDQGYDFQTADVVSWIHENVRNKYPVTPVGTTAEKLSIRLPKKTRTIQAGIEELDRDEILQIVQKYTNRNDADVDTEFDDSSISSSESFGATDYSGGHEYVDMKLYIMKETSRGSQASTKMYE